MKLIYNKYFVWFVGLVFLILSPQASYMWGDLKMLYLDGPSFRFLEIYTASFGFTYVWIFRILSALLNRTVVKNRQTNPAIIVWVIFSIFLPSITLIIQGFLMDSDRIKNKKHLKVFVICCASILFGILISGIIQRKIESHKRHNLATEYQIPELNPIIISQLDSSASLIDTSKADNYYYFCTGHIEKSEPVKYPHPNAITQLSILSDSLNRIRYTSETYLQGDKARLRIFYNTQGTAILKEYYFYHQNLEQGYGGYEYIKEYYNDGILIKKSYNLFREDGKILNHKNFYIGIRYQFNEIKTANEFETFYNFRK